MSGRHRKRRSWVKSTTRRRLRRAHQRGGSRSSIRSLGGLDPDRQPHEVPRRGEGRVRGRRVRHARRVLDQALDAAEALGELEDLRAGDRARPPPPPTPTRKETIPPKSRIWRAAMVVARDATGGPGRGRARRARAARGRRRLPQRSRSAGASGRRASSGRAGRASSRTGRAQRRATSAGTRSRSAIVGSFVATKPPITSEWPPRYLVVEWRTMSAPSESGCCRYGVANVLSTTTSAPAACAASAAARMSTMFSSGFVGVSSQTMRVLLVQVLGGSSRSARRPGPTRSRSPSARRPARTSGRRRRRRRQRDDAVARAETCA